MVQSVKDYNLGEVNEFEIIAKKTNTPETKNEGK